MLQSIFEDFHQKPLWCLWELRTPDKPKKSLLTENWLGNFAHLAKVPLTYRNGKREAVDAAKGVLLTYPEAADQLDAIRTNFPDRSFTLGFGLREESHVWCLDVDNTRNPETGQFNPIGHHLLHELHHLRGAAYEISSSGTGLHFFGVGELPAHTCRFSFPHKGVAAAHDNNNGSGLELYTGERGIALNMSGEMTGSLHCPEATEYIAKVVIPLYFDATNFPVLPPATFSDSQASIAQNEQYSAKKKTVEKLLQKNAPDFWKIFCNECTRAYNSESERDYALFTKVAYYADRDVGLMMHVLKSSPRGMMREEKWNRTLEKECNRACEGMLKTYSTQKPSAQNVFGGCDNTLPIAPGKVSTGVGAEKVAAMPGQKLTRKMLNWPKYNFSAMAQIFKGCYLIDGVGQVAVKNDVSWEIKTADNFNKTDRFTGKLYAMDDEANVFTQLPWDAFAMSTFKDRPVVDAIERDPIYPSGNIRTDNDKRRILNVWTPPNIPYVSAPDEVEHFFISHIKKILPEPCDHQALITWMCCVVQNPGHKMRWSPIIQGIQGGGKSLIIDMLMYACGGEHYARTVGSGEVSGQFNGYLKGYVLLVIEELSKWGKNEIETIKTYITNENVSVMEKFKDSEAIRTYCNFIFSTNKRSDMRLDENERRFVIYNTAQQDIQTRNRDLPTEYFDKILDWIKLNRGADKIAHWLKNNDVSECQYNPMTRQRVAPHSSQHERNVKEGMSDFEQTFEHIMNDQPCYGLLGGFIRLSVLKSEMNAMLPGKPSHRQYESVLKKFGYVRHPLCKEQLRIAGRVAVIYVRCDHSTMLITSKEQFLQRYHDAQNLAVTPEI